MVLSVVEKESRRDGSGRGGLGFSLDGNATDVSKNQQTVVDGLPVVCGQHRADASGAGDDVRGAGCHAQAQMNKVNPRKEFFRVGLAQLRAAVEERGIEASWTMAADAAEYRETLAIEQGMAQSDALAQDWLRRQTDFENREAAAVIADDGAN